MSEGAQALAAASSGLLHLSDGEAPFAVVDLPWPPGTVVSAATVAAAAGIQTSATATELSIDDFFASAIERADPADATLQAAKPRFQALKDLVRKLTAEPAVFRFGTGRSDAAYYVVGLAPGGRLLGVSTTATET